MANIACPKCRKQFDNNSTESLVTRSVAAAAGGAAGASFGGGIGIVGGPFGAINGLWVGAVVGASTGWFASDQFRRCPHCSTIFKT
jgi:hypothetical protein